MGSVVDISAADAGKGVQYAVAADSIAKVVKEAVNPPIPDSTKVQLKGVVLSMRGTGAVYVYAGELAGQRTFMTPKLWEGRSKHEEDVREPTTTTSNGTHVTGGRAGAGPSQQGQTTPVANEKKSGEGGHEELKSSRNVEKVKLNGVSKEEGESKRGKKKRKKEREKGDNKSKSRDKKKRKE